MVATERNKRLRQLSEVELQQRCHSVDVCVTADKRQQVNFFTECFEEHVIRKLYR